MPPEREGVPRHAVLAERGRAAAGAGPPEAGVRAAGARLATAVGRAHSAPQVPRR